MAKFNILSIDGGGIKGIISAVVIERLERVLRQRTGNSEHKIADSFDLIAGTSTGAILAGIYLCPGEDGRPKYSASDALKLYIENGEFIFKRGMPWKFRTLLGLLGPKYSNQNLKILLTNYLGNLKINEFVKPCLITSYDMGRGSPAIFTSWIGRASSHNIYAKDALLASAAAPTYFPPVRIESKRDNKNYNNSFFIDGGVFSNNPSMCAVAEALKFTENHRIEDISLLSVGNIRTDENYEYEKAVNYGLLKWVLPAIDVMMDGSIQTVDDQLTAMYRSVGRSCQYLRVDAGGLPHGDAPRMDDASFENIEKLIKMGKLLEYESEHKLRKFAEMFC